MTKKIQQIDYACEIGDRVFYRNLRGEEIEGTLIKWDSNLAVIELDDETKIFVEC